MKCLVKQLLDKPSHIDQKDYEWYKINIFTRWLPNGTTNIMIFDLKHIIKSRFPDVILSDFDPEALQDPYWFHLRIFEQLVHLQDEAVWAIRDQVRAIELVSPWYLLIAMLE
jgi:hypothetical protein